MDSKGPIKDNLKYYRIVRYWVKAKYGVSQDDFEMLLFLYSEPLFDITLFRDYEIIFRWDKKRLKRLMDNGWVIEQDQFSRTRSKKLYSLSTKAKNMIKKVYNVLDGTEKISTDPRKNPLFRPKANYVKRQIGKGIRDLNQSLKK